MDFRIVDFFEGVFIFGGVDIGKYIGFLVKFFMLF